jgi:uncharacterized protein YjbJ (UPF0337 family)
MESGADSSPRRPSCHCNRREKMDWHPIEGNWKQVKRKIKEKWGKLTDDDLDAIDGRRNRLEDRIHWRYGFAADHVRKEIDDWLRWQSLKSLHPGTGAKHTDVGR